MLAGIPISCVMQIAFFAERSSREPSCDMCYTGDPKQRVNRLGHCDTVCRLLRLPVLNADHPRRSRRDCGLHWILALAPRVTRMHETRPELTVFYDGGCPRCVRDRQRYERMAGAASSGVEWLDITGRDEELLRQGIEPQAALRELHVRDVDGRIHREIGAYRLLMRRVPRLRPLAWLIGLPGVRGLLSWLYRRWVLGRLRRSGRA